MASPTVLIFSACSSGMVISNSSSSSMTSSTISRESAPISSVKEVLRVTCSLLTQRLSQTIVITRSSVVATISPPKAAQAAPPTEQAADRFRLGLCTIQTVCRARHLDACEAGAGRAAGAKNTDYSAASQKKRGIAAPGPFSQAPPLGALTALPHIVSESLQKARPGRCLRRRRLPGRDLRLDLVELAVRFAPI